MPVAPDYDGDSAWNGVTFLVDQVEALQRPAFDRKATLVVTPIPYSVSNDWEAQFVGREPQRLPLQLTLYRTQFDMLEGMVGQSATLSVAGDTDRPNVMLESTTGVRHEDLSGISHCIATFVGV